MVANNTINADVTLGGSEGTLLANRYRVVRQLGQGGMGSVWLAEDTQLDNRQVAIKMLPSILVSNKRAYSQLKAEALVSLKLTHPNIATVRAFEENNGNPFLVVDYIDGQTLDDYLLEKCDAGREASMRPPLDDGRAGAPRTPQPGGLPEAEVIRLLTPIAAALDYAHSKGVIHRDVKPGNVMIAKDGTPHILDFGIAREIQETMTRVTGKLSSGTLMYMSPEQLNGDAPSAAQDVYSFAAMAYECLTGAPPFVRGAIEDQIKNKAPAPLGPHFMKCGQGVMAGLAKKPEDRPANCREVFTAGSMILPSVKERARTSTAPQPTHAETRKEGRGGWFLILLLLVFATASGVLGWKIYCSERTARVPGAETNLNPTNRVETVYVKVDPVVVTNTVVRVETNEVVRTLVMTNQIAASVPSLAATNRQDMARRNYLEIERLMTEIKLTQSYAEQLSGQVASFKSKADEIGIADDYAQAERLLSDIRQVATTATELHSVSNTWLSVLAARRKLDEFLSRFKMAELAHQKTLSERQSAEKVRAAVDNLFKEANECDAPILASYQYKSSLAKCESGKSQFSSGKYAAAEALYKETSAFLAEAIQLSRDCKTKAALQSAETFLRKELWRQALDKANEALQWKPDDVTARRVRDMARSRLAPTLALKATVDDKPIIGAKIVEGDFAQGRELPWTSGELEKNSELSSFIVEYREGKRKWRGSFKAITVDWVGPKTLTCPLKPYREAGCEFIPFDREEDAEYLVIDISGGPNAQRYPVSYVKEAPEDGWGDEYKSRKLLLRKINPGSFRFGLKFEKKTKVTLTKRYYIGVFEITYPQWQLVMGKNPSCMCIGQGSKPEWYEEGNIPCRVSYDEIRGKSKGRLWPESGDVDNDSFLGRVRSRSGITTLDIPTQAQWEYACRAGTDTVFYTGDDLEALDRAGWYRQNAGKWYDSKRYSMHEVGLKEPNLFGLYDMHGNADEWCVDYALTEFSHGRQVDDICGVDPVGGRCGGHVIKGGSAFDDQGGFCCSSARRSGSPSQNYEGFRIVAK